MRKGPVQSIVLALAMVVTIAGLPNAACAALLPQHPPNPMPAQGSADPVQGYLDGSMVKRPKPAAQDPGTIILAPPSAPLRSRQSDNRIRKPQAADCRKAAHFVRRAAVARDAGINPALFLATLENDLRVLLARPPAHRWFVQSELEAGLIRVASVGVFSQPMAAQEHAQRFKQVCTRYLQIKSAH